MTTTFEYPRDLRFTCSRCGDCCRNANILLTPEEVAGLEGLEWRDLEPSLAGVEPSVAVPRAGGRRRLARRPDGACIYLGTRNQCLLHEHFGAASKPLMCRLYPFNFYPVAGRTAVDCAFSCRAVSRGEGARLESHQAQWQELLVELGAPRSRQHRLKEKRPLAGELLWEIEQSLLSLLSEPELGLFDRIRCLLELTRLATSGDPSTPSAAQLRRALLDGLPRQIRKMSAAGGWDRSQRALFFQWLYLALNPATANQDLLRGRELAAEERRRIAAGNRYRRPQEAPFVDNRELRASFESIAGVDPAFVEAEGAPLVESFLRAKLLGQRYLLAGEEEMPLVEAVPKFLLVYPMAIWASQALAADRGAKAVAAPDLRGALRLLDRSLGQVSTSRLPRQQARACNFIMLETDFVVRSRNELFGVAQEEEGEPLAWDANE